MSYIEKLYSKFSHLNENDRNALFNLASPNLIDLETAILKLALLKENFEYQKFYQNFKKEPHLYLSIWSSPQKVDTKLSEIVHLLKLIRGKISKSRMNTDTIINNFRYSIVVAVAS